MLIMLVLFITSVPDCYKNQEMCNKTVDNYHHALEFVADCYMSQEMCDKVVNSHSSAIRVAPECYKTQKMCDKSLLVFFIFLIDIKLKKCVIELFLFQ